MKKWQGVDKTVTHLIYKYIGIDRIYEAKDRVKKYNICNKRKYLCTPNNVGVAVFDNTFLPSGVCMYSTASK